MSKERKKSGSQRDTISFLDEKRLLTVVYDHAIQAMESILVSNPPSHEGLARRMKEDWAKAWKAALEAESEIVVGSPEIAAAEDTSPAPAPSPVPPLFGEALVGLFCRRELREAVLGDLDEKFAELAERRGGNFAKAWYWSQAARSVLFFAFRWGRRLLELEAILRRVF